MGDTQAFEPTAKAIRLGMPGQDPPNPSLLDNPAKADESRGAHRTLLLVDDVVHELSARGRKRLLKRLHSDQPLSPAELAQYAKPLGAVTTLEALLSETKQEQPAAKPTVPGRRGRQLTTGRFDTRAELLERIWFFRLHTRLSDSAIADNVKVSPGVVAKIVLTQEGKPEEQASQAGVGTQQFRGRNPGYSD